MAELEHILRFKYSLFAGPGGDLDGLNRSEIFHVYLLLKVPFHKISIT